MPGFRIILLNSKLWRKASLPATRRQSRNRWLFASIIIYDKLLFGDELDKSVAVAIIEIIVESDDV